MTSNVNRVMRRTRYRDCTQLHVHMLKLHMPLVNND